MKYVVLGGSGCIGVEVSNELVKKGHIVYACGRKTQQQAKSIPFIPGVIYSKLDISKHREVRNFFRKIVGPEIDSVINLSVSCTEIENFRNRYKVQIVSKMRRMSESNIIGLTNVVDCAYHSMARRGSFVNVSSMGALDPFPNFVHYGATKAFVETFTKGMENQLRKSGGTNVMHLLRLGAVDTPSFWRLFPTFDKTKVLPVKTVVDKILELVEWRYLEGKVIELQNQHQERIESELTIN